MPNASTPTPRPPRAAGAVILSVGIREPRKRIAELVEGHAIYRRPRRPTRPLRLVVVAATAATRKAPAAAGPGCEIRGFGAARSPRPLPPATLLAYPLGPTGVRPTGRGGPWHTGVRAVRAQLVTDRDRGSLRDLPRRRDPEWIASAAAEALADREALAARGEAGRAEAERYSCRRPRRPRATFDRQALRHDDRPARVGLVSA